MWIRLYYCINVINFLILMGILRYCVYKVQTTVQYLGEMGIKSAIYSQIIPNPQMGGASILTPGKHFWLKQKSGGGVLLLAFSG